MYTISRCPYLTTVSPPASTQENRQTSSDMVSRSETHASKAIHPQSYGDVSSGQCLQKMRRDQEDEYDFGQAPERRPSLASSEGLKILKFAVLKRNIFVDT